MEGCEICLFCYKTSDGANKDINWEVSRFINLLERFTSPLEAEEVVNFIHGSKLFGCCELCGILVDAFCDEFHRMKCLEMKLEWKLERLVGIMELAGMVPSRLQNLQQVLENRNLLPSSLSSGTEDSSLEFLKDYRQKIIKRCNKRLSSSQPRVSLKSVNVPHKFTKYVSKIAETSSSAERDAVTQFSQPEISDAINIKLEKITCENLDQDIGNMIVRDKIFNPTHRDENSQSDVENGDDLENTFSDLGEDADNQELETMPEELNPASPENEIEIKIEPVVNKAVSSKSSPKLGPPLPCYQCDKTFPTKKGLRDHLSRVHVQAKYQCPTCKKLFKTSNNLNLHCKETKHKTPKECKIFQCSICSEFCATQWLLQRHIVRVHSIHSCKECPAKFKTRPLLKKHLIEIHKHPAPSITLVECDKCDRKFPNNYFLTQHLQSSHKLGTPIPCDQCGKSFLAKFRLTVHIKRVHSKPSHECPVCKKVFKDKRNMLTHQKVHDKPAKVKATKPEHGFPCHICGMKFKTKIGLEIHLGRKHDFSNFRCPNCPNMFKFKADLKKHMQIHLKTGQVNSCPECKKVYKTRRELVQHRKGHNKPVLKETNAICQFCGANFPSRHHLSIHLRLDHINKGTVGDYKLSKCSQCNAQFLNKRMLQSHMRAVHTTAKHQCLKCGMVFKLRSSLVRHEVLHEGKKIECNECGKMFLSKRTLANHVKVVHIKGKSLVCQFCGKYFANRVYMRNHLWKVHKDKGKPGLHLSDYAHQFEQDDGKDKNKIVSIDEVTESVDAHTINPEIKPEIAGTEDSQSIQDNISSHGDDHTDWEGDAVHARIPISAAVQDESSLGQPITIPKLENENFDALEQEAGDVSCPASPEIPDSFESEPEEDAEHATGSRKYSLRQKKKISYKQMEDGDEQDSESSDENSSVAAGDNLRDDGSSDLEQESRTKPKPDVEENRDNFPCPKCPKIYSTKRQLFLHNYWVHRDHPCKKCGLQFKTEARLNKHHVSVHNCPPPSRKWGCTKCDKSFTTSYLLKQHTLSTHQLGQQVCCEQCGKIFFTEKTLLQHIRTVHVAATHQCMECDKKFKTKGDLKEHQKVHTPNTKIALHQKFECSVCNSMFKWKKSLELHKRFHMDQPNWKFKCDVCDKQFYKNSLKLNHMRVHHKQSTQRVPAHRNNNQTSSRKAWTMRNEKEVKFTGKFLVHEKDGRRVFECKQCPGKLSSSKSDFNKHMLTHEKGEPLVCQFCGNTYANSMALQGHVRRLHRNTESKSND